MDYKIQLAINQLKEKVISLQSELENDIYSICEQMKYLDSGNFSYNIDRLRQFVNGLNEFELLPPPPTEDNNIY